MADLGSFDEMSALALIRHLNETDEHTRCEAKTSRQLGRSVLETICAFSNEPNLGGGFIILGVAPSTSTLFPFYEIVGVPDANKLQEDIATACRTTFIRPIRPRMKVEVIGGKSVVMVFVPELGPAEKPSYFVADGLPKGAYRRCGPTDQRCSEDDLIVFYGQQTFDTYDKQAVLDSSLSDIDPDAIAVYRDLRRRIKSDAEELNWNDIDLLQAISAARSVSGTLFPTISGLLLFGKTQALRRVFPLMRIDYIRVQGTTWIENPDDRFQSIQVRESLMTAVRRVCGIILSDLPRQYSMPAGDIQREESPILPEQVIREIVVNAVMHRCYRVHGTVQIIRYNNRIEVRNLGHSLISEEQFGQPTSQTRNPSIAAVMNDVGFGENKGSGLRAVQNMMKGAKLPPPVFESNRDANQFVAHLLMHHLLTRDDIEWLRQFSEHGLSEDENVAMIITREMGAINNATYRSISGSDTLTASGHLRRLRDVGLLTKKGNGNKTYYVLDSSSFASSVSTSGGQGRKSGGLIDKSGGLIDKSGGVSDKAKGAGQASEVEFNETESPAELPEDVVESLPILGKKATREAMRHAILVLCSWRPLMPAEIANYLNRSSVKRLGEDYISPMFNEGLLERTIPDIPAHPAQKYKTSSTGTYFLLQK